MTTPTPATVRGSAARAHEQPTPPAAPSRDQVETIVRHIATAYLEVERGLRPPQHLEPHLTSDAYDRLRRRPRQAFARGGPVGPRDLGPVSSSTYSETGRVFASLTAREQHDRWSGLLLQLEATGERTLVVSELERLPQRPLARQVERPVHRRLNDLLEWVEQERDVVEAAHVAERSDIAMAASYESRLAELDRELADLRTRVRHREGVETTKHTIEAPAQYVTKLIGQPPAHNTWARLSWDSARDAIEEYRQRYGVDDRTTLGPLPATEPQQQARSEVIRAVRTAQQPLHARDRELATDRRLHARPTLER